VCGDIGDGFGYEVLDPQYVVETIRNGWTEAIRWESQVKVEVALEERDSKLSE